MTLEQAINAKQKELDEMQKDIDSLEAQAFHLKEVVKKYNRLKKESSKIKKEKLAQENTFNTVLTFIKETDKGYIADKYPLFNQPAEDNTIGEAVS